MKPRANPGERRFQGEISADYALVMAGIPHLGEMDRVVADVIRQYATTSGGRLRALEIGCGSGRATEKILATRTDIHLTAIDNEPAMIGQARQNLQAAVDRQQLAFVESDALTYLKSAGAGVFDMVVSVLALHNFQRPYRDDVLGEIRRVLKPRGVFVNADKYVPDDPDEFLRALAGHFTPFLDAFGAAGRMDLLREVMLHEFGDLSPERISKADESLRRMAALGYRDCRLLYRQHLDGVLVGYKP